jgi:hypothetical protein
VYARHQYPPRGGEPAGVSYERNLELIERAKRECSPDGLPFVR